IPVQRFGYRQLMYYVVVKAVVTAVRGPRVGWGKLERRATAAVGARGGANAMPNLMKRIGVDLPIVQAPMVGTSTPALAAAVCNAGGLGSIGVGAVNAAGAREM